MKKMLCFVVVAASEFIFADETIEWTSNQTADKELVGNVTITVPSGTTVTNFGVLSGDGKLIKAGAGWLVLTAANTYTGGTQIDGGKLQAANTEAFGPVNAELPIQINADLNADSISASADNSIALVVTVTPFAYPINCSAWTGHGSRPKSSGGKGSGTLYNIAYANTSTAGTFSGKITGGDISIHDGMFDKWANNSSVGQALTLTGEVSCPGGAIAVNSRGKTITFAGKVTAGTVYAPTAGDWPTPVTFSHTDNDIGLLDCGRYNSAGNFTAGASNAFGGAKLISTSANFNDSVDSSCSANFTCGSYNQTIDAPVRYHNAALSAAFTTTAHNVTMSGGKTLTMKGTGDAENDWIFNGTMNLVWDPTNAYTLVNVSRKHTMAGTITVTGGSFMIGTNCTFGSVTGVNVGADATFGLAGNGTVRNDGTVPVTIEANSTLHIPEGTLWNVVTLKRGGNYLAPGVYAAEPTGDEKELVQMSGSGKINVLTWPIVAKNVTWKGGAGNDSINTQGNWVDDSVPDLQSGSNNLTFAQSGTQAVMNVDALVYSVAFNATNDFTVAGGKTLTVLNGGISNAYCEATDQRTYTISSPLKVAARQEWRVESNTTFKVTGPLSWLGVGSQPSLTIAGHGQAYITAASGATFSGPVDFGEKLIVGAGLYECPYVHLQGTNPIGTNSLTITGLPAGASSGRNPRLYLHDADLLNNFIIKGHYQTEFHVDAGTTNVIRGAFNTSALDFAPHMYVGKNAKLTFAGPLDLSLGSGAYDAMLWTILSTGANAAERATSAIVFDGKVSYPYTMTFNSAFGDTWFNAPSNDIRVAISCYSGNLHFGADYALSDGRTGLRPAQDSGTTVVIDLHGHPQHIGTLATGNTNTLVKSTEGPAQLRINQTNDVTFAGSFAEGVEIVKEGAGMLTVGSTGTNVTVYAGTLAFASAELVNAKKTVLTLGAGGKIKTTGDATRVFQLKYEDGNGNMVYADAGTYDSSHETLGAFFADGSGSLKVGQGQFPGGTLIMFH